MCFGGGLRVSDGHRVERLVKCKAPFHASTLSRDGVPRVQIEPIQPYEHLSHSIHHRMVVSPVIVMVSPNVPINSLHPREDISHHVYHRMVVSPIVQIDSMKSPIVNYLELSNLLNLSFCVAIFVLLLIG